MSILSLNIIGCGDIGLRIARIAAVHQVTVKAFSRGKKYSGEASSTNAEFIQCDLDDSENLKGLDLAGIPLIYTAPPPGGGIIDSRVENLLISIEKGLEPSKIVYLSTTSVYGGCGDDMITEEREINPSNHTAMRRCDAEQRFTEWCRNRSVPLVILRVSGIYGPGRIPMQRIMSREPLLNATEAGFTNRIHSDDLAEICWAAVQRGGDGDIFNVCDGEISKMNDYFNAITDLLGVERLPEVSLEEGRKVMSPLMLSYMTESRKISNKRLIEKLGIQLRYPSLLEGLKATL